MFEVTEFEAVEVVTKLLEKHFAKPIAHAVWSVQREVYGEGGRCSYLVTGVYPQTLRTTRHDLAQTTRRLENATRAYKRELAQTPPKNETRYKAVADCVAYYEREAERFREPSRYGWSFSNVSRNKPEIFVASFFEFRAHRLSAKVSCLFGATLVNVRYFSIPAAQVDVSVIEF